MKAEDLAPAIRLLGRAFVEVGASAAQAERAMRQMAIAIGPVWEAIRRMPHQWGWWWRRPWLCRFCEQPVWYRIHRVRAARERMMEHEAAQVTAGYKVGHPPGTCAGEIRGCPGGPGCGSDHK